MPSTSDILCTYEEACQKYSIKMPGLRSSPLWIGGICETQNYLATVLWGVVCYNCARCLFDTDIFSQNLWRWHEWWVSSTCTADLAVTLFSKRQGSFNFLPTGRSWSANVQPWFPYNSYLLTWCTTRFGNISLDCQRIGCFAQTDLQEK